MAEKVKVILVTDGDQVAQNVVEDIADSLGLRCISASGGNPTPISGEEIIRLLKTVPYDPVLVMFDDKGRRGKGRGESALEYVASHPEVDVLGAVAVASNTSGIQGVEPDACIDDRGEIVEEPVNKNGQVKSKGCSPRMFGDTVDVLNHLDIPVIIGVGDIGKMDHADDLRRGAPITYKAVEEILKRSGILHGRQEQNQTGH